MSLSTLNKLRAAQRRLEAACQHEADLRAIASQETMKEVREVSQMDVQKFRGILQRKDTKKWIAKIKYRGNTHQVGTYDTAKQAALARLSAELQIINSCTPSAVSTQTIEWLKQTALND